jgi:hypothetical protein
MYLRSIGEHLVAFFEALYKDATRYKMQPYFYVMTFGFEAMVTAC